jgi:hypothetical protein
MTHTPNRKGDVYVRSTQLGPDHAFDLGGSFSRATRWAALWLMKIEAAFQGLRLRLAQAGELTAAKFGRAAAIAIPYHPTRRAPSD